MYFLNCFSNFKPPYTRTILNVNEYIGEVYEQCNLMLSILLLDEKMCRTAFIVYTSLNVGIWNWLEYAKQKNDIKKNSLKGIMW